MKQEDCNYLKENEYGIKNLELIFLETFVDIKMVDVFWETAEVFIDYMKTLEHYEIEMPEECIPFQKISRIEINQKICKTIMTYMYYMAKSGDVYTTELIVNFYKRNYRAEYKCLKKLNILTDKNFTNICQLSKEMVINSDDDDMLLDMLSTVARVLIMCILMRIEIKWEEMIIKFAIFEERTKLLLKEVDEFITNIKKDEELSCDVIEEINAGKWKKNCIRQENFVMSSMISMDCMQGFSRMFNNEVNENTLIKTLSLLKKLFPKKDFKLNDILVYAHIYNLSKTLRDMDNYYNSMIQKILKIAIKNPVKDEEIKDIPEHENVSTEEPKEINNEEATLTIQNYENEIKELRNRLKEKEEKCRYFANLTTTMKNQLNETESKISNYENDKEELTALRHFVYNMSEETDEPENVSIESIKKQISSKKIVIIGGHINWINGLKKEFPNWTFVRAEVSSTYDIKVLENAEKVYFYTNHLSHSVYEKNIQAIRMHQIPFGYISTLNKDRLVLQIFNDLK